ncbi:sucrase ferredoxin [Nocardioides sp. zg-579]|uniref:Sucrase ferredoxin n=1 Tax=Nocardioides marmotae TaxID=2663857 RepID=A0A6I3JF40_9ACTN|nr:sucrase ferredoxin [Nocardioides marmotae]MCR6033170.1 sucrase ferredoxin [Gordonia jinghuaiqii]MTB96824.1 sucrase ferredoxin [Nocardioides marmotae]QKE02974.1 sucrase ferredoxin [Nocardioides marmotae]
MTTAPFRCSAASVERGEAPAGTASTVRAFLLIEHPGPWGVEALRDARLPDGLGPRIAAAAAAARVRPLLVRRPARTRGEGSAAGLRVIAASCLPGGTRLESGVLDDPHQVLDLDLVSLRAGGSSGLDPHDGTVLAVCTHGRHDACCAELGRPVAAALAAAHPEETWEVSHIGGDRYAGNLLLLPDGLYYGRLDPDAAIAVAAATARGHVELDHLRGRTAYPMAVQAAEVALRRALGETRRDAVRWTGRSVEGPATNPVTTAVFAVAGESWSVRVRTLAGPPARLTCRASRDDPTPRHEVEAVAREDAG